MSDDDERCNGCQVLAEGFVHQLPALTVTLENDSFTGSDNNYTNGIGISWVSNDINTSGS